MPPERELSPQGPINGASISRRSLLAAGAAGTGAAILGSIAPSVAQAANPVGPLNGHGELPPFSFVYDGSPSSELLPTWPRQRSVRSLGSGRQETTVLWTDPVTGLKVRWVIVNYAGYRTTSWRVFFENGPTNKSAILEDVLAVDLTVGSIPGGPWTIRTGNGSYYGNEDYKPFDLSLDPDTFRLFTTEGGRPTNGHHQPDLSSTFIGGGWPYYNVDWGTGGCIVALGWPGQWGMQITRPDNEHLSFRGGVCQRDAASNGDELGSLELIRLWLEPGETIRSPLVVTLPWKSDDWLDAQNTWRNWMMDHHMPRRKNEDPPTTVCMTEATGYFGFVSSEDLELEWMNEYGANGTTVGTGGVHEYWWMDAGWYDTDSGWTKVGTWEPDPERFPDGILPVTDRARELGMSTILWFEPQRVEPGTWLAENRPEWLLQIPGGGSSILNFGDPEARDWAIEHFNSFISSQRIDGFYREDHNINPLEHWNLNDPPDRRGITQIRHVQGHLQYWESIRDRNPGLLIDTCASGGRRNDIESVGYALPLLRSDWVVDPRGTQCQNYGVSLWLPFHGNQAVGRSDLSDNYLQRGSMAPGYHLSMEAEPDADWENMRRLASEWDDIRQGYLGNYYPLTEYSLEQDVWMAYQFHQRDNNGGFLQAFRRPDSGTERMWLRLRGLRGGRYRLTDYHTGKSWTSTSRGLMSRGISVELADAPSATTIRYERLRGRGTTT